MGDLTQFHIPIYQRSYTWDAKTHVDKLLDDIIEFGEEYQANSRAEYYIGNVILKNQTRGMITERLVIDGQQRITTVILTLCAIRDIYRRVHMSEDGERTANNIHKYLYAQDGDEIKLKLNNMENQAALTALLAGQTITQFSPHRLAKYVTNYEHIYDRLRKMTIEQLESFISLMQRVKVVIIFLDEDQDENSVFESINSLGKSLAGSDLIKNFLFTFKNYDCTHSQEVALTKHYTEGFESLFREEKNIEQELEAFYRTYIAIRTGKLEKKDPKVIYYAFKTFIGDIRSLEACFEIVDDITKWATLYQIIRVKGHVDLDPNLLGYLRGSFSTYSVFLLQLMDHYSTFDRGSLVVVDSDGLNKAFKAVVAYDAARFIANFPTQELLRFIPTIYKRICKDPDEVDGDLASKFIWLVKESVETYRIPTLDELNRASISNNLYSRKSQPLKRLLFLIENINKNELLSFEDKDVKAAQIEHIIPQNPAPNTWSHLSSDDHERLLHTLGNLSLTLDNQALSNSEFEVKRRLLLERSRIKLNNDLTNYDLFDANAVEKRARNMIETFTREFLAGLV
jgi:hypothetical protein